MELEDLVIGKTYRVNNPVGINGFNDESGKDEKKTVPNGAILTYVGEAPQRYCRFNIEGDHDGMTYIDIRPGALGNLVPA